MGHTTGPRPKLDLVLRRASTVRCGVTSGLGAHVPYDVMTAEPLGGTQVVHQGASQSGCLSDAAVTGPPREPMGQR